MVFPASLGFLINLGITENINFKGQKNEAFAKGSRGEITAPTVLPEPSAPVCHSPFSHVIGGTLRAPTLCPPGQAGSHRSEAGDSGVGHLSLRPLAAAHTLAVLGPLLSLFNVSLRINAYNYS